MPRVKGGTKNRYRHKKVLKRTKGFYSSGSRLYSFAREKGDRALVYAYRDRKARKRSFRRLWTVRINAAARENGTTYSRLMHALKTSGLILDRKVLADMAVRDAEGFRRLIQQVGISAA